MTQQYTQLPPWPPGQRPFAESQHDSTGHGADFPSSAGDRERGKFRPSATPLLTTIAVVNDDGTPIGHFDLPSNDEMVMYLRAIAKGIADLNSVALDELLEQAAND